MVKETHVKGGYALSLLFLPILYNKLLIDYKFTYKCILIIVYVYFSYLGSLSPDIDLKNSYISKRYPFIYKKFGSKFKHRGFTHSLICLSLMAYTLELLTIHTDNNIVFLCMCNGFFIGYLSHLLLDLLTKEGIEIFCPLSINFSILPIKTNSKGEKFIYKLLNFVVIFLIVYRFYILL